MSSALRILFKNNTNSEERIINIRLGPCLSYELSLRGGGGSICNENSIITLSTNALGLYAICQTKDQSVAVILVHETLFYLSKFNKLQAF